MAINELNDKFKQKEHEYQLNLDKKDSEVHSYQLKVTTKLLAKLGRHQGILITILLKLICRNCEIKFIIHSPYHLTETFFVIVSGENAVQGT